jgi:hypothetical protein
VGEIERDAANVRLVNSLGTVFFENNISKENLKNGVKIQSNSILRPGIYVVLVNSGEKILRQKLVIN